MARKALWILALTLGLQASAALASVVPQSPAPRYVDEDPAAMVVVPPPGQKAQFRRYLDGQLQAHPGHPILLVQRGHEHYARGNPELGERDFEKALAGVKAGSEAHRRVLWSWGWAYLRAGRHDDAIAAWLESARLHGGRPFWVPYTLAGAYASKGDLEQAAAWFDQLVLADGSWATEGGFVEHTRHWNDERQGWMRRAWEAWLQQSAAATH